MIFLANVGNVKKNCQILLTILTTIIRFVKIEFEKILQNSEGYFMVKSRLNYQFFWTWQSQILMRKDETSVRDSFTSGSDSDSRFKIFYDVKNGLKYSIRNYSNIHVISCAKSTEQS